MNDPRAFDGYTLFAPSASLKTYLIDNCGRLIHQWTSTFTPGQSVYLLQDGSILRTARINSTFQGGGSGGRIENYSWENTLLWSYVYSSAEYHQHHDIELLPNGNILILAWERVNQANAIAAGRNPATVSLQGLWPEHIVEIKPIGTNDAEIIWEWHAWDHLIQDYDSTKPNFGEVVEHPERIDLNFAINMGIGASPDWLHCNSVDYHPELDQILLSVHNFNEVWIIDHSTTTEEAAGHSGGNAGRGGDLLYRWGNPLAYGRGTQQDQVFNGQHNARWVKPDRPGEGQISVYNNNHVGEQGSFSSIDFFLPPIDSTGKYSIEDGQPFGPDTLAWYYDGMPTETFHSNRLSSAQRLPNGNTLICAGNMGKFIEVTLEGEVVWEYVSPVSGNNEVAQGSIPAINDIFHADRYDVDYSAFAGRVLTPGEPIEKNPLPLMCDTLSSIEEEENRLGLEVSPNPCTAEVTISCPAMRSYRLDIFAAGQLLKRYPQMNASLVTLNTIDWPVGLICIVCTDTKSLKTQVVKLIKL